MRAVRHKRRVGQKRTTYDGGSFVLVELLLKERDAERQAEKVDRVASPGKPSSKHTLRLPARMGDKRKWHAPGKELSPLDPRDGAQCLEEGSAVGDASFATWDETADKIRRHLGVRGASTDKWRR